MALLLIGSVAAVAGTAAYVSKKSIRSPYQSFAGDEDPRFDPELFDRDPEHVKSLTKFYSIEYPEILIGWRIKTSTGRSGTVVNCHRRFARATKFHVVFTDKTVQESIILNRKHKTNKRKYIDFDLVSREF